MNDELGDVFQDHELAFSEWELRIFVKGRHFAHGRPESIGELKRMIWMLEEVALMSDRKPYRFEIWFGYGGAKQIWKSENGLDGIEYMKLQHDRKEQIGTLHAKRIYHQPLTDEENSELERLSELIEQDEMLLLDRAREAARSRGIGDTWLRVDRYVLKGMR